MMKRKPYRRLAAIIIPTALLLLAIALLLYRLNTPFDGIQLVPGEWNFRAQGVAVTPLYEQPEGIHRGDVVVAVEGESLENWAQSLFRPDVMRPEWNIGQTV